MSYSVQSLQLILVSLFLTGLLVLAAIILRHFFPILQRMHMPAAVIGGFIGLALGPQALGVFWIEPLHLQEEVTAIYKIWKQLPAFLISLVFAELMMGHRLPSLKSIWKQSASHLVVGYSIAWGQYVVGILVALLVLAPVFGANPLNGVLIAIGFQGGYGTAAGLGDTYAQLGFEEGYDLALGMATAGKVAAILVGLVLINMAVRFRKMKSPEDTRKEHLSEKVTNYEGKKAVQKQREEMHLPADRIVLHFSLLCTAVAIGWIVREAMFIVESWIIVTPDESVMQFIPLFPMALIGGAILQAIISALDAERLVNARHLHSLGHSFLDLLIIVAIASLSIKTLIAYWELIVIMVIAGVGWNLLAFFFIAPRLYKSDAWVRGVGDFAHSTGATTTGLMLMKMVDPNDRTGVRSSFTMKQSFYEPIVGGGFLTALALPLMHTVGPWYTLGLMLALLVLTLLLGWKTIGFNSDNRLFS